jgi:gamma-glutamyl-gamma-aminobutyrate hydrolase PuuD
MVMAPRIAIPVPHSGDQEYAERSLPQYERAVAMAGGEPVRIPVDQSAMEVMKLIERCDAVLLPGSKADVDPAKYDAARAPQTAAADSGRDTVDELLLQDAYNLRKPILGICYGLQTLNVYRTGTLIQHIQSPVNHAAGRKVPVAHTVEVEPGSKLAGIVCAGAKSLFSKESSPPRLKPGASTEAPTSLHARDSTEAPTSRHAGATLPAGAALDDVDSTVEGRGFSRSTQGTKERASAPEVGSIVVPVNSSHHQAADVVGDGLRVVARSPEDGVVEALEGTSADHFVLAVQWHPERSVDEDEPSQAIFWALVDAARARREKLTREFKSV